MIQKIDKTSQTAGVNLPESLALFSSLRWMSQNNSLPVKTEERLPKND